MHLFVECPFSCCVWEQVADWSNCGNLQPVQWGTTADVEEWFLKMIEQGNKTAHTLAILTAWCIWNQRNAAIFRNEISTPAQVCSRIKEEALSWKLAGGKVLGPLFVENNTMSN